MSTSKNRKPKVHNPRKLRNSKSWAQAKHYFYGSKARKAKRGKS